MWPHFTIRTTPLCHVSHLRIANSDIVDPSVPTKPFPPDWMTASMRRGYLYENQAYHEGQNKFRTKSVENVPSTMQLFRGGMVRGFPPQFLNVGPPFRITLIACHDNVLYIKTLLRQQLLLNLANAPCNDRERSKTIFQRGFLTIHFEISMANVDTNILCDTACQSDQIECTESTYKRGW